MIKVIDYAENSPQAKKAGWVKLLKAVWSFGGYNDPKGLQWVSIFYCANKEGTVSRSVSCEYMTQAHKAFHIVRDFKFKHVWYVNRRGVFIHPTRFVGSFAKLITALENGEIK